MKIVLRIWASDGSGAETSGLDCAVVDVTPELVESVRLRGELLKHAAEHDENASELLFSDYRPAFYGYELVWACEQEFDEEGEELPDGFSASFHDDGLAALPDGIDLSEYTPERTELDRMVIRLEAVTVDGKVCVSECEPIVCWRVQAKGCDRDVETAELSLTELKAILVTATETVQ